MSNFDDDDDIDFNVGGSNNNKLASLFKMSTEAGVNESLKYKAPKQPQQQQQTSQPVQQQQQQQKQQQSSSVIFFANVQAFKYINNRYDPQGQLGLAILSNQNTYKLLLYVTKTQPIAIIRVGCDFKIALQKSNYLSFYDETRQLWSILFDSEETIASFVTQITLCKCNILQGSLDNVNLSIELKLNESESSAALEPNDTVEIATLVTLWKDMKLAEVIENTQQSPMRCRLGKNKLPKHVEEILLEMKQGDRKLFVLNGSSLLPFYQGQIAANSVVFYDLSLLRFKKNEKKDRSVSNAANIDQIPLPQIPSNNNDDARSRSESIRDKKKVLAENINDPKAEKAKLFSRMAKMGQSMLPILGSNLNDGEREEEWDKTSQASNTSLAPQITPSIMPTMPIVDTQSQTAILLQQQQQQQQQQILQQQQQQILQQQQFAMQNQLIHSNPQLIQNQPTNQLALFKNVPNQMMSNQLLYYPQQQIITQAPEPPQSPQAQPQGPTQSASSQNEHSIKIFSKLEQLSDKLDHLRSITNLNNQNLPSMETSVLLQNIQRIVRENEQCKKDLYDKSGKIEELNAKITELLIKSQNYVEQSHQMLEQKNFSYHSNSEKNINKVLELEQDKMNLTGELTKLTSRISELNLEINLLHKNELEAKQKLIEVSKNTDSHKQNSERLLVENADLQTKLDTVITEFKKERHLRKSLETKVNLVEEEGNEMRASLLNFQKLIEEKKKKQEQEKSLFEAEIDELKKSHGIELNELKDKLTKLKTKNVESQSEQMKQIESDLNKEWQVKLDKLGQKLNEKHEREVTLINEEKLNLAKQINDCKEILKQSKFNQSKLEVENEGLKQRVEDLAVFREKFERLQAQAVLMKERYEGRIRELLDAEPDSEVIAEQVKTVMNSVFKTLKTQIKPEQFYAGNGILSAMLKIIKMCTLQVLHSTSENDDSENVDYFSQHIYKTPEPVYVTVPVLAAPVVATPALLTSVVNNEKLSETVSRNQEEEAIATNVTPINITTPIYNASSFDEVDEKLKEVKVEIPSKVEVESSDEDDGIQLINEEKEIDLAIDDEMPGRSESVESLRNEVVENNEQYQSMNNDPLIESEDKSEQFKEINKDNLEEEDEEEKSVDFNVDNLDAQTKLVENEEIEVENEENAENEDEFFKEKLTVEIKKPVEIKNQQSLVSKGLFDDDDDEDDDFDGQQLFSFNKKPTSIETKKETNDDSNTIELNNQKAETIVTNNPLVTSTTATSTTPSTNSITPVTNTTTTTTTPASSNATTLASKFSPPPLFDDESNDQDIDWFK